MTTPSRVSAVPPGRTRSQTWGLSTSGLVGLVVLSTALMGCNHRGEDRDRRSHGAAILGVVGTADDLNYLIARDPASSEVEAAINRGFTRFDDHWTEQPMWAKDVPTRTNGGVTGGGDHLTLTYTVRDGARWADGTTLDISDFMFTTELSGILGAGVSPGWTQHLNLKSQGSTILAVTFNGAADDPRGLWWPLPAHVLRPALDKGAGLGDLDFNKQPLSSGPFSVASNDGRRVDLVPNTNYTLSPAKLSHLVVRFFPDHAARLLALQAGDVDVATDLSTSDVTTLTSQSLKVDAVPTGTVWCLSFPQTDAVLSSLPVRQYLASHVDRAALVKLIQPGGAPVPGSWLPPQCAGYLEAFPAKVKPVADTALAAAKLTRDTRGWRLGSDPWNLDLLVLTQHPDAFQAAQTVAQSWQDAGVHVTVSEVSRAELTTIFSQNRHGTVLLAPMEMSANVDPSRWFASVSVPSRRNSFLGTNLAAWSDKHNDDLCAQISKADGEMRTRLLAEQQKRVAEAVPVLPLFYELRITVHDQDLLGVASRGLPDITWNAEEWHWK